MISSLICRPYVYPRSAVARVQREPIGQFLGYSIGRFDIRGCVWQARQSLMLNVFLVNRPAVAGEILYLSEVASYEKIRIAGKNLRDLWSPF